MVQCTAPLGPNVFGGHVARPLGPQFLFLILPAWERPGRRKRPLIGRRAVPGGV